MLTGVSSKWKVFETYVLRYTRLLVETSPKFPIYFPKVYNNRLQATANSVRSCVAPAVRRA
jgi:hypothetical protein